MLLCPLTKQTNRISTDQDQHEWQQVSYEVVWISEHDLWILRCMMRRGRQPSAESITTNIQTSCALQIRSRTVLGELHGMGFQGQAAASKSYIIKHNAMRRMQWCKARHHCTLKVTIQAWLVCLVIWLRSLGLAVARRLVHVWHLLWQVERLVDKGLWCGVVFQELGPAP